MGNHDLELREGAAGDFASVPEPDAHGYTVLFEVMEGKRCEHRLLTEFKRAPVVLVGSLHRGNQVGHTLGLAPIEVLGHERIARQSGQNFFLRKDIEQPALGLMGEFPGRSQHIASDERPQVATVSATRVTAAAVLAADPGADDRD